MRHVVTGWLALVLAVVSAPLAAVADDADGFVSIFDGKQLGQWDGNPDYWRVENGAIVGENPADPAKATKGNTFCVWRAEEPGDFEFKLEYKIVGGNSGIQYRSVENPNVKWSIGGYQADIDSGDTYSGINYGEGFGGILANRGQKTVVKKDGNKDVVEVLGQVGESAAIQAKIKKDDWNSYHVSAKGFTFEHRINGTLTSVCTDERPEHRAKGLIALQLHAGPAMKVYFRNIQIKRIAVAAKKKALLIAGFPSHGFGAHDHLSGCHLLAKLINESGLPIEAEVHSLQKQGWPSAEKLAAANTILIYSDGGGGHPFNAHLEELNALTAKGTGIVCIHYGVETTKGKEGDAFLNYMGAYFEPHWSVNPHWVANYTKFPEHQVTRGVKPFKTNDEWYYHMRFRGDMAGVVPILTDLPPKDSLSRPDGPHSGNPDVRAAIEKGEPQHMAWARQRPDGGRGFGCTGGHVHWNWGCNNFRRLILNAIVWTAGIDVPADGVPAGKVTVDDLLQNHDEEIPADFNKQRVQAMIDEMNKS